MERKTSNSRKKIKKNSSVGSNNRNAPEFFGKNLPTQAGVRSGGGRRADRQRPISQRTGDDRQS